MPLISEVGFPIVVTLYLLYRIESKLGLVVQSIQIFQSECSRNKAGE
ncbi:YvrJ family protein [Neobacillus vireti]